MAPFRPSRDLSSLRFRLPLFLMLYCSAVALVLYVVASQVQDARFEQAFEGNQLLRATELQSRTERAAERKRTPKKEMSSFHFSKRAHPARDRYIDPGTGASARHSSLSPFARKRGMSPF